MPCLPNYMSTSSTWPASSPADTAETLESLLSPSEHVPSFCSPSFSSPCNPPQIPLRLSIVARHDTFNYHAHSEYGRLGAHTSCSDSGSWLATSSPRTVRCFKLPSHQAAMHPFSSSKALTCSITVITVSIFLARTRRSTYLV